MLKPSHNIVIQLAVPFLIAIMRGLVDCLGRKAGISTFVPSLQRGMIIEFPSDLSRNRVMNLSLRDWFRGCGRSYLSRPTQAPPEDSPTDPALGSRPEAGPKTRPPTVSLLTASGGSLDTANECTADRTTDNSRGISHSKCKADTSARKCASNHPGNSPTIAARVQWTGNAIGPEQPSDWLRNISVPPRITPG